MYGLYSYQLCLVIPGWRSKKHYYNAYFQLGYWCGSVSVLYRMCETENLFYTVSLDFFYLKIQHKRNTYIATDGVHTVWMMLPRLADCWWSWYVLFLVHQFGLTSKSSKARDWLNSAATDRWLSCWCLCVIIPLCLAYVDDLAMRCIN